MKKLLFCLLLFGVPIPIHANGEVVLPADDSNGIGFCYRPHDNTGKYEDNNWGRDPMDENSCTESQYTELNSGEWIARFIDADITGISLCTDIAPFINTEDSPFSGMVAENQEALNSAYYASINNEDGVQIGGQNCYCKSLLPNSNWIFDITATDSYSCERYCAAGCARNTINDKEFFWAIR